MSDHPTISVVTGTRNRPDSIRRFMASLQRTCEVPTELIIADASDTCLTTDDVAEFTDCEGLASITVLEEKPRMGFTKGYNAAFRECEGEWVVWFNDDCECVGGWQSAALEFMRLHPEVGIGCVYFKDHCGRQNEESQFRAHRLDRLPYPNFGFIRRALGNALGWFDEELGWMYGSDTALGFKAIDCGYGVVPIPGCKVRHYRIHDEVRRQNYATALHGDVTNNDNAKFNAKWRHRMDELLEKHKRFEPLVLSMGIN